MKLYRTTNGIFVEEAQALSTMCPRVGLGRAGPQRRTLRAGARRRLQATQAANDFDPASVLAPIVGQEVWAAGVTYFRSRSARMEESKDAGGGNFYDRVYAAERPELFFKATGRRVVGPGVAVRIRSDARWSVPEPELTLLINPGGTDRRLHHRQRYELARYRGRKSALSAAGQGLRRQLRARTLCSALAGAARQVDHHPLRNRAQWSNRCSREALRSPNSSANRNSSQSSSSATTAFQPAHS